MGIIEIILTIFAWRNGWKWKALIPIAVVFTIGFTLGMFHIFNISAFFDVLGAIALILMIVNKPKETKNEENTKEETKKD